MNKFKESEYYKSKEHLENAKNAIDIAKLKNTELKLKRIDDYNKDPRLCEECNNPINYEKRHNKCCCRSCSASYTNKKRVITDEMKNKISKTLTGKGHDDIYKICKKCGKYFFVKWERRTQQCCSISCSSQYRMTNDMKEHLSNIMSTKIKDGIFKPELKSIKCLYKFHDKEIRCDSKVEYSCLNYFETNFNVLNIERCDFLIDFDYNGINKKYNPDFTITTENETYIVECKTILSNKDLVRKWQYYYDTIEPKKEALNIYCIENNYIPFNYNKSMNIKFYNSCKPNKIDKLTK